VISGLQAGERVIIDGIQHVKPDAIVQAKEVSAHPEKVKQPNANPQR